MNSHNHPKSTISLCITFALVCFGLLPIAHAVSPAPDGGYPGGNTAEGDNALFSQISGLYNTAVGLNALYSDTSGSRNTANGVNALRFNVMGNYNTALGVNALYRNTSSFNTAIGDSALFHNTTGGVNSAFGYQALQSNMTGSYNSAIGNGALLNNTGDFNTAIGNTAGANLTTGSGNVCIGAIVFGVAGESNTTRIRNIGNTPQASGIFVTISGIGGIGDGKLGYQSSSGRYKEEVKPMEQASESLYRLTPVTFHYKRELDPQGTRHYGLIAEEVAKVEPDLVVNDEDGKPATLRFLSIQAMMLNEFIKEHRRVQEQEATIAELKSNAARQQATIAQQQKQIEALGAGLQKMNAQVELGKAAPQTVLNDQ
jgi:uncharacterized coiled-coil protein SlyX